MAQVKIVRVQIFIFFLPHFSAPIGCYFWPWCNIGSKEKCIQYMKVQIMYYMTVKYIKCTICQEGMSHHPYAMTQQWSALVVIYCNFTLLQNEEFCEQSELELSRTFKIYGQSVDDARYLWDSTKAFIINNVISNSSRLNRDFKEHMN